MTAPAAAPPSAPAAAGEAPLVLLGAARSGTSLLYKALCLHPDVAWISNWVRRFPGVPALAALNRLPRRLPAARRRTWFRADSNAYVYGSRRPWAERLFPAPVEGEPLYAACGVPSLPGAAAPAEERQARALRRTFAAVRRHAGGRVLVTKRIANNWRVPLLARAFPAARWVNLVRDGRAVAVSLSRVDWWEDDPVWWAGTTPRGWREAGGDPWEICARNWVEEVRAIEDGLRGVAADRVLEIRYEDFVRAPQPTLERVLAFAGLSPLPAWRDEIARLGFPNRNERWREGLDPAAERTILAFQGDLLRRLGYLA